jgi:dTDP-4-dehydrorhamnose reductase
MKVLIFGYRGMLGRYLYTYLRSKYEVIGLGRSDYDVMVDDISRLEALLVSHNINSETVIINACGTIPQASKNHEVDERMFIKVNAVFPNVLALLAEKYGAQMIHSTTDCVYDGLKGNYTELDPHTATSIYGISKSMGEPSNCTVIRTSIIGEEINNQRSLLEWAKSNRNREVNGYMNHYWNGITCLEYAKIVDHMIEHKLFWRGVRHIVSPTTVSKYQLLQLMNDAFNLNLTIKEYNDVISCNRALSSIYEFPLSIPELGEQLKELALYSGKLQYC